MMIKKWRFLTNLKFKTLNNQNSYKMQDKFTFYRFYSLCDIVLL